MISYLQKKKAALAVRLEKLRQGFAPSEMEVLHELAKEKTWEVTGDPRYRPPNIRANSITNSTEWNRSFRNLSEDLQILLEGNILMNNAIIGHQEKSGVVNSLMNSKVDLVSMKLEEIRNTVEDSRGMQGFSENFRDFRNIDGASTVDVNLKEKSVTLEKQNTSRRYDISGSTVTVTPLNESSSQEHYGKGNSILNDFYNEIEIYRYTVQQHGTFAVELKNILEQSVRINTVHLSMASASGTTGILYLSEDGMNFTKVYDAEDTGAMEWMFEETEIKALKIILRKSKADGYSEGMYDHYFILRNLSLMLNIYEQEGVLLGRPIKLTGAVDKVRLHAEDIIFNHTNIVYSIGVEREDGKVQWTVLENGESADLKLLSETEEIVNRNDQSYGQDAGDGIHRIYRLPSRVNIDSIRLNPGYQMWYRERLKGIGGYGYTLSLSSYDADRIDSRSFIDTEEYQVELASRDLDVLTQYVECDEDIVTTFPYAFVEGQSDSFQQILFCNGTKIAQKKGSFTVSLKKGMNKIIMFLYLGSGPQEEIYSCKVTTKVNFREVADNINAFPKMKYVNPHTLRRDTLPENYLYYSIEDDHLVVKHVPDLDTGNYNNEMRYYLSFRYLKDSSPYVRYRDGEPYIRVRLKALLVSSKQSFTPKIMNYQLSSE